MPSRLIAILSRTYGAEACQIEMECALKYQQRGIVGVDLAGDEARQPARNFAALFDQIRSAGLMVTAHAGEFAGAESVKETIEYLHPNRLGHAVHAVDDRWVMEMIKEQNIAVECCPTSNYLTTSIVDYEHHPLPLFLYKGICATINTDDPALMGNLHLVDEFRLAKDRIGCSDEQINQVKRNGWKAAFLSTEEKVQFSGLNKEFFVG